MIDNKGRLFGKFNIIDIMVVVFFILILGVGIKYVYFKPEPIWMTAEVLVENESPLILKNINIGDVIGSEEIAEIINIDSYPSLLGRKNVILLLNLSVHSKGDKLYFNNQELSINREVDLHINNILLQGVKVLSIEGTSGKDIKERITVIYESVEPYITSEVSIGDSEVSYNDRVIAMVKGKTVSPAQMLVVSETGNVFIREHPLRNDMNLTIELIAKRVGGSLIFHNQELKLGNEFLFETSDYIIKGRISKIGEDD